MQKVSQAQIGQMMVQAGTTIENLTEENAQLKAKLASYEKRAHAEKIASAMEEKGLNRELSYQEKVASIMQRDNLEVFEEAVGMAAPQLKLASVHEDPYSAPQGGEGEWTMGAAEQMFAQNLAMLED